MHINEVHKYRAEKEHLMRNEGAHPANYSREERERQKFVENDGDYEGHHLSVRRINPKDNDKMKNIDNAYGSHLTQSREV